MKLSKENRKRQEAIRKALAAGKPLGGVLAGLLSVAVAGCGRDHSPASTMGSYPNSSTCTNSVNENPRRVPMGDLITTIPAGTVGKVLEGPVEKFGYMCYKVEFPVTGWIAERDFYGTWIIQPMKKE